ncbi:MAG: formyltetrahydrofolate deformylase [Opitutales bacterium]|nr:formyltetrahydrofolate deformylase [Opitutales bacterium]
MPDGADNVALIALLHGPDKPGLVAATSGWIYERGGNIVHADQHRDDEGNAFFQRIEWIPGVDADLDSKRREFESFAESLGMNVSIVRTDKRKRIALFVSKIEHCFLDLLARWKMAEFQCDIACILSNHENLKADADFHGIPFYYIPVTPENKPQAEAQQLEILTGHQVDLAVMARYMQVLSKDFLDRCGIPVINIHHSFLPAFAGAKPYHQAYQRGVKLIGATAHYATAILDDGPIIQQDVSPVTHRQTVRDLIRKGRDLEKSVLAQAVRCHLEHRVLVYGNKTVVFD